MKKKLSVNCPVCDKKIMWDKNNPDRPFCSSHCKLIDLGAWASDEYRILGQETPADQTEFDEDEKKE